MARGEDTRDHPNRKVHRERYVDPMEARLLRMKASMQNSPEDQAFLSENTEKYGHGPD